MKRRLLVALVILGALLLVSAGCLFTPIVITESDQGSLLAVNVGDSILVQLDGNPSTGFSWFRTHPSLLVDEPLEALEEGTCNVSDQCGPLGRPGTYEFRYRAIEAGTVTLAFSYQRPWEEEPADTFAVVIWVR